MPTNPSGSVTRPTLRIDWRAWLALAWAAWFGCLYARMVLEERAPGILRAIESFRTSYR
ncbi:hypothetical protein P12x_001947 [Tundrisphaera lichenicola]|uniref:hypothetical protein n=1 Tax=Tundrisphaera lichenicola TaxID=2029860 RepID=UPI003EBF9D5A